MSTNSNPQLMARVFFDEYTSHTAILTYTRATAGFGVSYLLDHDYKDAYCKAIDSLPPETKTRGIRILEYGCGGGMNLVHLCSVLKRMGIKVNRAVGTDFSPVLIKAAKSEAKLYLPQDQQGMLEFHVAKNENLTADIAAATSQEPSALTGSFDFIFGVNTNRYCHRFGSEVNCARNIWNLLSPGGVCVMIDMNNRFPAFRSKWRKNSLTPDEKECYIPSLAEYAAPFEQTGFQIIRKEHFCWVPHSSGPLMCRTLKVVSPILNTFVRSRAMRSLVVATKPATARMSH